MNRLLPARLIPARLLAAVRRYLDRLRGPRVIAWQCVLCDVWTAPDHIRFPVPVCVTCLPLVTNLTTNTTPKLNTNRAANPAANPAVETTDPHVASYLAKYVAKSTDVTEDSSACSTADCMWCLGGFVPAGTHPILGLVYAACIRCDDPCPCCGSVGVFPADTTCTHCLAEALAVVGYTAAFCHSCAAVLTVHPTGEVTV